MTKEDPEERRRRTMAGLQVRSRQVLENPDSDELCYLVHVTDDERPWLEVELRVLSWHNGGPGAGDEFYSHRLLKMGLTSENLTDALVTTTLRDGEWWRALFERVLQHLAYETSAFIRACERNSDTFTNTYQWDGDYLYEDRVCPSTRTVIETTAEEIAEEERVSQMYSSMRAAGRFLANLDGEPMDAHLGGFLEAIAANFITPTAAAENGSEVQSEEREGDK